MKRTIMIGGFILALMLLSMVTNRITKSSDNMADNDHYAFAQDLEQTEGTKRSGGEDLLSHYLWVNIDIEREACSDSAL